MIFGIDPDWEQELDRWGAEFRDGTAATPTRGEIAALCGEMRGGDPGDIYRELVQRMTDARREPNVTEVRRIADDIAAGRTGPV